MVTTPEKADSFDQQCSGERPVCVACVRRVVLCMYDIDEGTTWLQDLRNQLSSAQTELERMKRSIHSLKCNSDADAAGLLARLRMGENIAQLASAESLHQKRHVHSTFIYQSKPVKLIVGKGYQSQNMLAVLFYQYNIPLTILWKLEHPTSMH